MTISQLAHEKEQIETHVERASRGDDMKMLVGLLVRGIWEIAVQLERLNEKK